jgi:hypothetical protein
MFGKARFEHVAFLTAHALAIYEAAGFNLAR